MLISKVSDTSPEIAQNAYSNLSNLALNYAKNNWPVLPLHSADSRGVCSCMQKNCKSAGKHPRIMKGLKDASTNPDVVARWWSMWPTANIGVLTGSPSGLVVLDVDVRHGGDVSWNQWISENEIPMTYTVETGGGFHLYFFTKKAIKNRVNILPGVDVRADGGYIVAPGSIHANQKKYFARDSKVPICDLPESLEILLNSTCTRMKISKASINEGERNSTLTSIGGLLNRHGITENGIKKALSSLNDSLCSAPLDSKEISNIATSVSKYKNEVVLEWNSLKSFPQLEMNVPSLLPEYLPKPLQSWLLDIAERMQVPLEFLGAPVVTSLSSVIGRQIGIYPKQKDDWFVVPNLWGSIVARPGFFKSPAISEAMKPLEELVKKAHSEHEAAKILAKAKEEMLKAKIDGLKDSIKKSIRKGNDYQLDSFKSELEKTIEELEKNSVYERRYKTNDATTEKLACLINENPKGLLLVRDELSGWLKSMQKAGREGDREFYLEAWNGYGSFSVDRIGRGSLHVEALCLSIFGGLQPSKLESYVNQAVRGGDDGLLQRFQIIVYPETPKKWKNIDRKPKSDAFAQAKDIYLRLAHLKIKGDVSNESIPGLHFTEDAQEIFNSWRTKLEERLRSSQSSSPVFESHLAKYRSLVPSLALIFHLVENNNGTVDVSDCVSASSLLLALKWADFLEAHARKVYFDALYPNIKSAQVLAAKIAQNKIQDKDSLRSIYRHHWSSLDTIEKLEEAISVLEDVNWVRVESVKSGNTSSEVLRIHPSLGSSELLAQFR